MSHCPPEQINGCIFLRNCVNFISVSIGGGLPCTDNEHGAHSAFMDAMEDRVS